MRSMYLRTEQIYVRNLKPSVQYYEALNLGYQTKKNNSEFLKRNVKKRTTVMISQNCKQGTLISSRLSVCLSPFVCVSLRSNGKTRLPLDKFSLTLTSDTLSKICQEN